MAEEICEGLSASPKYLPSKYFYDARGDELFQQIMSSPEYYLTDCEREILDRQSVEISRWLKTDRFDLLELGAGDGSKTRLLLQHFLEEGLDFRYVPVDISGNVLGELESSIKKEWPDLPVRTLQGEYLRALAHFKAREGARTVVLFLGSSIGNFQPQQADAFLKALGKSLPPESLLLIGFDLKKNPEVIFRAYNDRAGITRNFNLNLLRRLNLELGADFDLEAFLHWPTYNPITGAMKSYLVSLQDQTVHFARIHRSFHFKAWEPIDVELSQKYSLPEIEKMAQQAGFRPVHHFHDSRNYFVDSLWELGSD